MGRPCGCGCCQSQFLRPAADISNAGWSGATANLFEAIDEAAPDNATSEITATGFAGDPSDTYESALSDPAATAANIPNASIIYLRVTKLEDFVANPDQQLDITVKLLESSTLRDTFVVSSSQAQGWTTRTRKLATAVKSAIVDWSALSLQFTASYAGLAGQRTSHVTQAELEIRCCTCRIPRTKNCVNITLAPASTVASAITSPCCPATVFLPETIEGTITNVAGCECYDGVKVTLQHDTVRGDWAGQTTVTCTDPQGDVLQNVTIKMRLRCAEPSLAAGGWVLDLDWRAPFSPCNFSFCVCADPDESTGDPFSLKFKDVCLGDCCDPTATIPPTPCLESICPELPLIPQLIATIVAGDIPNTTQCTCLIGRIISLNRVLQPCGDKIHWLSPIVGTTCGLPGNYSLTLKLCCMHGADLRLSWLLSNPTLVCGSGDIFLKAKTCVPLELIFQCQTLLLKSCPSGFCCSEPKFPLGQMKIVITQ